MPEITIQYKKAKTLQILKGLAKYFDFVVLQDKPGKVLKARNKGSVIIKGDSSIDTSDMNTIFSGKDLNAAQLRAKAWQRRS